MDTFLGLGRIAIDTVLPFFSLFKDERVAPTIAVLMVLAAVCLGAWFAYIIWQLKREVTKRLIFMKGCQDHQDFYAKFDEFDSLMMRSKLLGHSWDEYKETLLPQKSDSTIIESTLRPGDFINLTELEHSGLKLKWFHAVPGVFVGVGLLFTFIGLVAALFFASQAIHAVGGESADTAQQTARMQAALAQLLGTATFKFWTSIAGLGSSIFLGMFYRHRLRRLDGSLDALCREIERCTRTVTPEVIADRQLGELREQSSQLKQFTGQLAFNLGKALEDALNKAMPEVITNAMSPLGNGVSDISKSINDLHKAIPGVMGAAISPITDSLKSLTKNTNEFSSAVSEKAGAEIKVASNELATVAAALKNASEHITGSGNGLSGQIAEAAGDLRAAAKAITEGISDITNTVRADVDRTRTTLDAQLLTATQGLSNAAEVIRASLADAGGKMRSTTEEAGAVFTKQVVDAVTRIESGTQANTFAIQQALAQLRDMTTSATGSMATETKTVVAAMRATAEQMAQAVAEITSQIRRGSEDGVAGLTERLVKAAETMQAASDHNSERIGQAVERIINAGSSSMDDAGSKLRSTTEEAGAVFSKQIADSVARIENGTQANTTAVQQALAQLRDMTTSATGSMATETNNVVAAMRVTAEQMAGAVAEITSRIRQDSEEGVGGLTERLIKAAEAMQEASNRNSERIEQAVERIIAAGNQAEAGVGKAAEQVANTLVSKGKEAAAQVVSGADQVMLDFKSSVDDLGDRIENLWRRLDKVSLAMGEVENRIGLHAQALDGVNRVAKETESSMSAAAMKLIEAGQPLNQATFALKESIDGSSRNVEATTQALGETLRQSTALSEEIMSTLEEFQDIWGRHASRFDNADENLGRAVEKIMNIVDWNTTKLDEQVKAMDSGLAQAVGTLAGNIEELEETAREFHEVAQIFSDVTKSLGKPANRQAAFYR